MRTTAIRPATSTDIDTLVRIWSEGWRDGHLGHVPDLLVSNRTVDSFVPRVRQRIPDTWVADHDGEVVGFVVVLGDEVEQVYVDRRTRGSGAAALLLGKAETIVGDRGYTTAWLAVVAGNARARAFYERQGWSDRGPFDYTAETASGPITVPVRRYERVVGHAHP